MSSRKFWISAVVLMASASTVYATPFDGLYAPAGSFESWSCKSEELGGDGGAVGVTNNYLHGVENDRELTNPTNVRGMDAVPRSRASTRTVHPANVPPTDSGGFA